MFSTVPAGEGVQPKNNKIVVTEIVIVVAINVRNAKCTQLSVQAVEKKRWYLSSPVAINRYIVAIASLSVIVIRLLERPFQGKPWEGLFICLF